MNAEARICQDIILDGISKSKLGHNVTIKGGVVMRNLSKNERRATQDMNLDFIKFSINDDSIKEFIEKLNDVLDCDISIIGSITELKHQDYKGKRVNLSIRDNNGVALVAKLDIGVHKDLDITQEEYCFDICYQEDGASLLMNSKEQMLTEKLKSLLKFGTFSTRYKDVFDICYLSENINKANLRKCFDKYIFSDSILNIKNYDDIKNRINSIFENKTYIKRISTSNKNWLDMPLENVLEKVLEFIKGL